MKVESVSLPVYERAVRNCPWCVQLWQNYILLFERMGQSYEKVKGTNLPMYNEAVILIYPLQTLSMGGGVYCFHIVRSYVHQSLLF